MSTEPTAADREALAGRLMQFAGLSTPDCWEIATALAPLIAAAREEGRQEVRAAVVGAEVRLSPDERLVAIRYDDNDWRVSNGGHYRDKHVEDWTPCGPVAAARAEGERRVAGWALLLANEFEALARTSDLIADDFAAKDDAVTEQWHRGLAEARRTSASRLRAAVAPAQPAEGEQ